MRNGADAGRIAEHRLVDEAGHHAGRDHPAPPGLRGIVGVAEQRVVVAAAIGPVADRIVRGGLDVLGGLLRLPDSDQLPLALDIRVENLVGDRFLPLFALLDIGFRLGH